MPPTSGPVAYAVLLPVKPPGRGKTRLGDLPRDELARAFALDTATASLATPSVREVLVVTDDADFASALSVLGCTAKGKRLTGLRFSRPGSSKASILEYLTILHTAKKQKNYLMMQISFLMKLFPASCLRLML
jgi:hypothetical protein